MRLVIWDAIAPITTSLWCALRGMGVWNARELRARCEGTWTYKMNVFPDIGKQFIRIGKSKWFPGIAKTFMDLLMSEFVYRYRKLPSDIGNYFSINREILDKCPYDLTLPTNDRNFDNFTPNCCYVILIHHIICLGIQRLNQELTSPEKTQLHKVVTKPQISRKWHTKEISLWPWLPHHMNEFVHK